MPLNFCMKAAYLLLLIAFSFTCKAQSSVYCINGRFAENDFYAPIAIDSQLNIQYGFNTNISGAIDTLHFDIYYPNTVIDPLNKRPLVMMVHGGGFVNGSKTDLTNYCRQLARRGYVAATINYRLGWNSIGAGTACTGNIPQLKTAMYRAAQDVDAALRYLNFYASDYAIDTDHLFAAAQSEGALALLLAAFCDQTEADVYFPGLSADMGGLHQGTNLIPTSYQLQGIFNWCGAIVDTNMIDANENIPVLSIHGLLDNVMPVDTGNYLSCNDTLNPYPFLYGPKQIYRRMQNLGICSENNFDASGQHCYFPSLEANNYLPSKFTCFFKNLLCGNCHSQSKTGYNSPSCMDAAPTSINTQNLNEDISVRYQQATNTILLNGESMTTKSLKISLYSLSGQMLYESTKPIHKGYYNIHVPLPNVLASGLYLLQIQSGNEMLSRKIVVE